MPTEKFLATCPKGIGLLLVDELTGLGATEARELPFGVEFDGSLAVAYRACLWSHLANRILLQVADIAVGSVDDVYDGIRSVPWQDHVKAAGSLAVDFSGRSGFIRNSQFGAQKVKDGIVDGFRARGLTRPSVDLNAPDVRVHVRLNRGRLTVFIDLSGDSLHRRGYRIDPGKAPLKENLAAAVVIRAGWPEVFGQGGALIDPMCGSGTLLIEGALMALDRAPGLGRQRFGFDSWLGHNPQQWRAITADAQARVRQTLPSGVEIRGYDGDVAAIRRAEDNVARFGMEKVVRFKPKAIAGLTRPSHSAMASGLVVCNPPWGERVGRRESLPLLYGELGSLLAREFRGWSAAILTNDRQLGRAMGLRSHRQYRLSSGPIDVSLLLFDLSSENELRAGTDTRTPEMSQDAGAEGIPAPAQPLSDGALMLLNRLKKNGRRLQNWIKRDHVDAYRLYDADIPEYAVAIDVYAGIPHLAEYAPPRTVTEAAAERRLNEALDATRSFFGVDANVPIACKRRQRQRGTDQYVRQADGGQRMTVREGAVKALINLHDYLDTGLFLDHRPLRLRIAQEAPGKHFLNLFCYTGVASLHAALGGAATSTSVDLSKTYLDWYRDNLALNGLSERQHRAERADVMKWLEASDRQWDLILLDPPSFSNSKAMEQTFDVQRDHEALLSLAMARLNANGRLYFSNNRRKFRLGPTVTEQWHVTDITAATLPPDFQRGTPIHQCWCLSHQKGGE